MRALSLTQPWATAVAIGIKQWETRSWPTSFRGQVAIHAAKGFPRWAKDFALFEQEEGRLPSGELPLGAIVCMAEIVECRQTVSVVKEIGEIEQMYGDYGEGRYAFKLINVRPLIKPVPCKGALSFWPVGMDTMHLVLEQLPQREVIAG